VIKTESTNQPNISITDHNDHTDQEPPKDETKDEPFEEYMEAARQGHSIETPPNEEPMVTVRRAKTSSIRTRINHKLDARAFKLRQRIVDLTMAKNPSLTLMPNVFSYAAPPVQTSTNFRMMT
jgi:hypothetical protein